MHKKIQKEIKFRKQSMGWISDVFLTHSILFYLRKRPKHKELKFQAPYSLAVDLRHTLVGGVYGQIHIPTHCFTYIDEVDDFAL